MGFLAQKLLPRKVKDTQTQPTFNILKAQSYLYCFFLLEERGESHLFAKCHRGNLCAQIGTCLNLMDSWL